MRCLLPQGPSKECESEVYCGLFLDGMYSSVSNCSCEAAAVYGAQVQGEATGIDVRRLGKRKAPPRFGRKLTAAQAERATHICVDCGYIYCDMWVTYCARG